MSTNWLKYFFSFFTFDSKENKRIAVINDKSFKFIVVDTHSQILYSFDLIRALDMMQHKRLWHQNCMTF